MFHLCLLPVFTQNPSGKSTFLSALAGTTSKSSALQVSGAVWMENSNGTRSTYSIRCVNNCVFVVCCVIHPLSQRVILHSVNQTSTGELAFLQQHDAFFSMLSVRETLDLAAFLELPSTRDRDILVEYSLDALGLKSVQHRRIGDRASAKAGLSGGERRRLSVALELITTPKLFLADEPTTGLDSTQAQKVVDLMYKLAKERNIPCLCSLHQPRASIWKKLDSFILLAPGGRVCYMGERQAGTKYFAKLGYQCPPETNPAEYFIDLVSIDTEDPEQAETDQQRIDDLAKAFVSHTQSAHELETNEPRVLSFIFPDNVAVNKIPPFQWMRRFGALLLRSWRQNIRNNWVNGLRLGTSIGQAILLSEIFCTVRKGVPTAKSIADRTALLSFGAIQMSMVRTNNNRFSCAF